MLKTADPRLELVAFDVKPFYYGTRCQSVVLYAGLQPPNLGL